MTYSVELTKVDALIPYEDNPRINEKAVEKVMDSINSVGWRVPIITDENMVILAGHTRLKAAKNLGLSEVPVHKISNLTEEKKRAFRIMDNKSADFSEWDRDLLTKEFDFLSNQGFDLSATGFEFEEIEKMTKDLVEFKEPTEVIEDIDDIGFDNLQASNIRMINIFLDTTTEPVFQNYINFLREKWNKNNLTETVFNCVKKCAENEGFKA